MVGRVLIAGVVAAGTLGVVAAGTLVAAGQAEAASVHCATTAPVSGGSGFIAKDLTASGVPAHDPHGSPCHIANRLTYYAEKQNGLPSSLALDPDGQPWAVHKWAAPGNATRDTFTHGTERVTVVLIKPMSTRDAKRLARQTLDDFEAAAHPDPYLNVPDDVYHSDGGNHHMQAGRD